jgi:hypothetical protein
LSDLDKRARFDRGEIDASGPERPRQRFYRDFAERWLVRDQDTRNSIDKTRSSARGADMSEGGMQ